MNSSTTNLLLASDSYVDLQTHTTYSDGRWAAEDLLDHFRKEDFGLAAITDHDRPDIAMRLQQLAIEKQMPVLIAVEMTTTWHDGFTDVLCYGFDPGHEALLNIANDLVLRQRENTRESYLNLVRKGYLPEDQNAELARLLALPSSAQPFALVGLIKKQGYDSGEPSAGSIVREAGGDFMTNKIGDVVEAAHQSGAVCLIAHPGRQDGFICYDVPLLEKLRAEVPIDGLEVHYPKHTEAQTAMFREYARKHKLLMSAGSDSHGPEKPPIKYPAALISGLLERVGVRVG